MPHPPPPRDRGDATAGRRRCNRSPHAGIYLHVPFCRRKCPYCDFFSLTRVERIPEFVTALCTEIGLFTRPELAVDSIYFGGGTPSLLNPAQVTAVLEAVHSAVAVEDDCEITLEANPGTLDGPRLAGFRRAGVNRLSIGAQSFQTAALAFLGRLHTGDQARRSVAAARRAGFDRLALDLICGLPGQTPAAWEDDLAAAVGLGPDHLSCYLLGYEPGTPLERECRQGRLTPLDDERAGELFARTHRFLAAAGYHHYEVSNFARRPALRSRHNQKVWHGTAYLGFGPGAHSFVDGRRRWNAADLDAYLAALAGGRRPPGGSETPTRRQRAMEILMLGLRTADGVNWGALAGTCSAIVMARIQTMAEELRQAGMLVRRPGGVRLTPRAWPVADAVVRRFVNLL